MTLLQLLIWTIWSLRVFIVDRLELVAENLVYRQQLACYEREERRPQIGRLDRILWACRSACWSNWSHALIFVQPATVIGWHRQGFKLFWAIKSGSGRKRGRPQLSAELRTLIRKMSIENPLWGSPRIVSELALLGHVVCEDTVRKYMVRRTTPPSQTWRTFFANHDVAACDPVVERRSSSFCTWPRGREPTQKGSSTATKLPWTANWPKGWINSSLR